ncbi:MAG: hydrogenase maturation protease [Actinobacteria bacterium]|nr:MAG: hydrogenase maturation protease [Actinomycetota bacterium]
MRTVVIGVGNPYRRDDGVGSAVAELLRDLPGVEVAQSLGETTDLMELWDGADLAILVDAILVDAVRTGPARPGRIHRLSVPAAGCGAASTHGPGLGEAVELARVLDRLPARLVLYAVEVTDVGHGRGLSLPVAAASRRLAERIRAEVSWCA